MLSKKKIKEINSIAFSEATKKIGENDPYHSDWLTYSPETWNKEERHFFDSMMDLSDSIASKIIELLNKRNHVATKKF